MVSAIPTFTSARASGAKSPTQWSQVTRCAFVCLLGPTSLVSRVAFSTIFIPLPSVHQCPCDLQIVGVVTQTGSSVTHLKEGDTVGFGWFKDCCQQCNACVTGNDVSSKIITCAKQVPCTVSRQYYMQSCMSQSLTEQCWLVCAAYFVLHLVGSAMLQNVYPTAKARLMS